MTHALIDADRIPYAFGGFTNDEGYPIEWGLLKVRIDDNIQYQCDAVKATEKTLFLTSDDKSNFRFQVATILPYKGHRSSDKPFWYEQIRRYLIDEYDAVVVEGMEADDALGIEQTEDTVICSVDKDLDMIPGKHFNELKPTRGIYEISELDALRNFYGQCLTGDSTDNILGLYGVGRSSKLLDDLARSDNELDMYRTVRTQYEKRFGSYWKKFLWENGALLWIKRSQSEPEEVEIQNKLINLEVQFLENLASEAVLKKELNNS